MFFVKLIYKSVHVCIYEDSTMNILIRGYLATLILINALDM